MARSVSIQVAGQLIRLRTDATDDALREISGEIDSRVAEIRAGAPSAPAEQVIALVAISLADERRRLILEMEELRTALTAETQLALQFLDEDAQGE